MTTPTFPNAKCLIKDCTNRRNEGLFKGDLCAPCFELVHAYNIKAMCRGECPDGPGVPMELYCPMCHARHIDEGDWAIRRHHTHSCQSCGHTWRPALVCTVGVQFLPGFKNT